MHHRPGGLLRGSLQPRLRPLLRRGWVGGRLRQPGSPPSPHGSPPAGSRPPPPPRRTAALSSPPHPRRARGRAGQGRAGGGGGSGPPEGCCRAPSLRSLGVWGRERRAGRHCCQWRLLTQIIIIIIRKNRYSWVPAEYGNYYYCQSRLEIIIPKARGGFSCQGVLNNRFKMNSKILGSRTGTTANFGL